MQSVSRRRIPVDLGISLLLTVLALGLVACSDDPKPRAQRDAKLRIENSFVGALAGTDALVGVGFPQGGSEVVAYLSDGDPDEVGRAGAAAEWFVGAANEADIDLMSRGGANLQARVEGKTAKGTITFQGGRRLEFVAEKAEGDKAGLYREEASVGDASYLLGWIVLNDGKARGSSTPPFIRCTEVVAGPLLARLLGRICP